MDGSRSWQPADGLYIYSLARKKKNDFAVCYKPAVSYAVTIDHYSTSLKGRKLRESKTRMIWETHMKLCLKLKKVLQICSETKIFFFWKRGHGCYGENFLGLNITSKIYWFSNYNRLYGECWSDLARNRNTRNKHTLTQEIRMYYSYLWLSTVGGH